MRGLRVCAKAKGDLLRDHRHGRDVQGGDQSTGIAFEGADGQAFLILVGDLAGETGRTEAVSVVAQVDLRAVSSEPVRVALASDHRWE